MSYHESKSEFRQELPSREQLGKLQLAAAVAILSPDGKVLLGHRVLEHGNDWVYPGGAVDQNETLAVAARREVREEAGIALDSERNKLFPLANYITAPDVFGIKHDLLVYVTHYQADQPQPIVASPNEITEWGWFDPQNVLNEAVNGNMKVSSSGIFAIQRAKEYLSSEHTRTYGEVLMGGTFDRLHAGHQQLLKRAFEVGDYVFIGLTTDAYIQRSGKFLKEMVTPYEERIFNLRRYLEEQGVLNRVIILPLEDTAGPKALDPKLEAIIISEETREGGTYVNNQRIRAGVSPMSVVVVPILNDEKGVISSSRLRLNEATAGQVQET